MLKTSPSAIPALVTSTKMLLVAPSLVVLFTVLFIKSSVGFATVALMALGMVAQGDRPRSQCR